MAVSQTVFATVVLAMGGAVATVGVLAYQNRASIRSLQEWAWGRGPDETDEGVVGVHESMGTKIDRIEEKLDAERDERKVDHAAVEREIHLNRYMVKTSVDAIIETLNEHADGVQVDPDDIHPDWAQARDLDGDPPPGDVDPYPDGDVAGDGDD